MRHTILDPAFFIRLSLFTEAVDAKLKFFLNQNVRNQAIITFFTPEIQHTILNSQLSDSQALWLFNAIKQAILANDTQTAVRLVQDDIESIKEFTNGIQKGIQKLNSVNPALVQELQVSPDLMSYKTKPDLYEAYQKIKDKLTELEKQDPTALQTKQDRSAQYKEKMGLTQGKADIPVFVSTNAIDVYKIETSVRAVMEFGKGTGWCTANQGQAMHYLSMGPIYVLTAHGNIDSKIAQLHCPTNQYKDTKDVEITNYPADQLEALKLIAAKEPEVNLYFTLRNVPGFSGNIEEMALFSPSTAYQYATSQEGQNQTSPQFIEQVKALINKVPSLEAYMQIFVARTGDGDKYVSDSKEVLEDRLIQTGDSTALSRWAGSVNHVSDKITQAIAKSKNPTATVEYVSGGGPAKLLIPIWDKIKEDKESLEALIKNIGSILSQLEEYKRELAPQT